MSEPKEYRITTMADMLAVPEDRREEMLIDLAAWLTLVNEPGVVFDTQTGGVAKLKWEPVFIWVDDGLRDVQRVYVGGERYDRDPDRWQLTDKGRAMLKGGE